MKQLIARSFFRRVAVIAAALLATHSGLHAASDDRPNILWIIVEDASCHIEPYGETAIKTPSLDALATQGATYSAAFVTLPVCSASRSAMITGMNQATLGVHNHRSQMDSRKGMGSPAYHDSYHLPIKMIPELFKQAGHHTSNNSGVKHQGKHGKTDYSFIWSQFQYDSAHWLDCPKDKPFFAVLQLKGGKSRKNDSGKVDPDSVTLPPYYPDHQVFNPVRPPEERYDLQRDPHETVNLAADAQHEKALLALRTQLYDQMASSRDLGLIPEPILEDMGKRYGSKFHILMQPEHKTLVRDLINLIEAGERQDVSRLLKGLKDESPSVCYWAATSLGNRKVTVAGSALVKTTGHADPTVRIAAALALCRLGRPNDGADVILKAIEDDNWLAGMYAIRALEWSGIRTPAAHAAVIRALDSPYEFTRRIAQRLSTQF